jgi:transcriptional regulator NrdR family protein
MTDEAETLRGCLDKLATLMEVADQLPPEQRDRIAMTIQIVQAAIQAVAQAQVASEKAGRLVEEAKEVAQRLSKSD